MTSILTYYLCQIPNTIIRVNNSFQIYLSQRIKLAIPLEMSIVHIVRLLHELFQW